LQICRFADLQICVKKEPQNLLRRYDRVGILLIRPYNRDQFWGPVYGPDRPGEGKGARRAADKIQL